jgi:dTDP-4-amino-4,6-dideoxygalactose transaminase
MDADDCAHLIDASLDMWLTAGRYADQFEEELAAKFGRRYSKLTVSGSAANLLAFACLTSWKLGEKRIKPGDEVITVAAGFPTTVRRSSNMAASRCSSMSISRPTMSMSICSRRRSRERPAR